MRAYWWIDNRVVEKCPWRTYDPAHYNADGTCKCKRILGGNAVQVQFQRQDGETEKPKQNNMKGNDTKA